MIECITTKTHKVDKEDNLMEEHFFQRNKFLGITFFKLKHDYVCTKDYKNTKVGFTAGSASKSPDS